MKDLFISARDEFIEELMAEDPELTWSEAYDIVATDRYRELHARYTDKFADMVDYARQLAKDRAITEE